MKIKIIYLASLLLVSTSLSLSSCSQDSDPAEAAQTDQSISFAPYIAQTRSSVADIETLKEDGFHVWISYNKGTTFEREQDNVSYLYDEPVHYSMPLDGWDYLNKRFWPTDDAKLSFFALANGGQNLSTEHTKTDAGAPVYTFDCPARFASQPDLLAAQDLNKAKSNNQVRFNFQHMLSKIGFTVGNGLPTGTLETITLKKVEAFYAPGKIYNKAHIDLNDMGVEVVSGAYYTGNTAISAGVLYESATGVVLNSQSPFNINENDDNYLMLIPQVYDEDDIYLKISYDITSRDTAHYGDSAPSITDSYVDEHVTLPTCKDEMHNNIGWQKNCQYTYNIAITPDGVDFNGPIQVSEWGAQTNTNVPDIPVVRNIYYQDGVFHINNAEGLKIFAAIVNGGNEEQVAGYTANNGVPNDDYADGQLESDIDLSTVCGEAIEKNWEKIGSNTRAYRGDFDGQNHTISHLYITNAGHYTGLFGWVKQGSISNVTIQHATVHGNAYYFGSLIGVCINTPVTNCHARGTLSIGHENSPYVGGLIAHYNGSSEYSISDCSVQGDANSISISGTSQIGGLVSEVYNTNVINCFVQAGTGSIAVIGNNTVGGFIGRCTNTTVVGCYTAGADVTGTSITGAFSGYTSVQSHIYGCWANCSSLQGSENGFYGTLYSATISNCHYRLNDADALNALMEDLNAGITNYNNGAAADKQAVPYNAQGTYGPIVSTEIPD